MSDMVDTKTLLNRAISHKAVVDSSKRDIRDNKERIKDEERKLKNLLDENELTRFSYEYLDKLVKEESGKFIKNLNDMLNYAIKVIFYDCDYSIEIKTEDNSRTSINLKYTDEEGNPINANIKDCGGGVQTVVSTILNLFFIFQYKLEPIYLVDEGFTAISRQYVTLFFDFINELAEKNDLKVLLITHDVRLMELESIKNRYSVEDGKCTKMQTTGNEVNS